MRKVKERFFQKEKGCEKHNMDHHKWWSVCMWDVYSIQRGKKAVDLHPSSPLPSVSIPSPVRLDMWLNCPFSVSHLWHENNLIHCKKLKSAAATTQQSTCILCNEICRQKNKKTKVKFDLRYIQRVKWFNRWTRNIHSHPSNRDRGRLDKNSICKDFKLFLASSEILMIYFKISFSIIDFLRIQREMHTQTSISIFQAYYVMFILFSEINKIILTNKFKFTMQF